MHRQVLVKILMQMERRSRGGQTPREAWRWGADLAWSGSTDRSRLGSRAGRGLGVRARGPVEAEVTEPSGVKARGEQGSMKS